MPLYYGFGYGYGIDPFYLIVVVVSLVLGVLAKSYIDRTYQTWSKVRSDGATGSEVARRMLDEGGAHEVGIESVAGKLTDHYDPRDNNLYLSDDNLRGGSVASVAVACHEAGHAIQREQGFALMRIRTTLVPVVNFAQRTWALVFIAGIVLSIANLQMLAILLFGFSVVFQLVTLPVEIDASRRAVAFIEGSGMSAVNVRGARRVLTAAALTYVSAALISIMQLLYLLSRSQRRN